jgi:hypothetical protein
MVKKSLDPPELVMLTHGKNTNFPAWKESMRNEIAMLYGDLVNIIDLNEVLLPTEVDEEEFNLDDDPHGVQLHKLKAALTSRQRLITDQEINLPKCRALIWKYLSRESMEAVLRHEDYYDEEEHRNDPLQLYLSVRATHPVGGGALDDVSRRSQARQTYRSTRQGPMESIAEYKTRFTFNREAYDQAGNVELPEMDVAMDFFNGLDNGRYARFKADTENDRAKGIQGPQDLNSMFHRASNFVVVKSNWRPGGGAAFATRADEMNDSEHSRRAESGGKGGRGGRGDRGNKGGRGGRGGRGEKPAKVKPSDDSKATADEKKKYKKQVICFNCNEEGHMSYNCPNDLKSEEEERGSAYASFGMCTPTVPDTRWVSSGNRFSTLHLVSDTESDGEPPDLVSDTSSDDGSDEESEQAVRQPSVCVGRASVQTAPHGRAHATMRKMPWWEVLLDNQADISVVHPRLLTNIRRQRSYVSGLAGTATLPYVGELKGFFKCKGSASVLASVLCMADVEDMYDITYEQGVSYTVHLDDQDLVFYKRDKLYVADMREWGNQEYEHVALVSTAAENESKYTAREVQKARLARDMVVNAGFSSEKEALGLVNDGNLTGVPITARDVKRSFEIYGKTTSGVRGRRTAHKARMTPVDPDLKSDYGEFQTMYGDVVYFRDKKPFMMCLTKPLHLITVTPLENNKAKTVGAAVHTHVSTVQSRGFQPTTIYLDAQRGFSSLDANIPGVEVVVSGAGDHMDPLDLEVRHLKERFRSIIDALPWEQPEWADKDLACYCASRKNLLSTPNSVSSARVQFTGRKPVFKKELGLAYGDYCECYIPNVVSKNAFKPRTEPCIALYPTGNANGSWVFLNIKTKRRVRRTNWQKMVTTELVIDTMNEFSKSEEDADAAGEEDDQDGPTEHEQPLEPQAEPDGEPEIEFEDEPDAPVQETIDDPGVENEPLTEVAADDVAADVGTMGERRSARLEAGSRRPMRYRSFHTSVRKGLKEHGADAYKAIVSELRQLLSEKKALKPVHRGDLSARQLKRSIRSLMFLKTKFDGLGRFEKIKARLVANGKQQDRALYPDTYSPTVGLQSVLMCLTIAAKEGRKVCAVDIGGAYLNAERVCDEGDEIVMELEPMLVAILAKHEPQIKPYVDEKGRMLVTLSKAMYGTLDAAKIWYEKLTGVLRGMGFVPNEVDPCVLNKNINGKQCSILLYVDDLLITCADEGTVRSLKSSSSLRVHLKVM